MSSRRSESRGREAAGLSRAQTLDLCARLASYGEAGATPSALLLQAGGEAARSFADDVDVLVAVGRMYLMGEELGEAEAVLRRAVRRAPGEPHALRLLGEVMLRQGDPTAAHEALSKAVAAGMHDPWTKTWVARALDYSELADDLGREGIAKDVRQVLGKPGQGPQQEEDRRPAPVAASPPPRRQSRTQVLGKIDKGVFFPGDPRAELPDLHRGRWGVGPDDVVDLPTPAPGGVAHVKAVADAAHAPSSSGAERGKKRSAGASGPLATALAEDAAWGGAASDPMPPSDTEISAWAPELEAAVPRRRSVPPVVESRRSDPARKPRSTEPPPPPGAPSVGRVAPLPPGMPRLSAGELFDEFTENRRPVASLLAAAAEVTLDATSRRRPPASPPDGARDPAPSPPRKGPPPLPPETARGAESGPRAPAQGGLLITVLEGDMEGPVTAPPSALVPLSEGMTRDGRPSAAHDVGPETAPASALLPPEPPSLVFSKKLAGVGSEPARAAAGGPSRGAEGAASAAAGATAAAATKPRSRVQMWALRAVAFFALGALLAGGFEMYKRNRATKIRALTAQASIALHGGGPVGVAEAEAALEKARSVDPKSRIVATSTVRMLFFAVIDVDPGRAGALGAAMEQAATRGVASSQMAFAQIARAMATGDSASASEIIANYDEDPDRAGDALYQLAAGAALEAQDPAAAIERYRAAAKANADVLSTEIRLIRGLAYSGHGAEARQRLAAASQKWPDRAEVTALGALVAAADPRHGDAASLPASTDPDALPRPLRAMARCISKSEDEKALAKAIAEAEMAQTLVLCGEIALRAGHDGAGRDAAKRALEMAPGYGPAYGLVARVALVSGRFEEARQAALRAPDVAAEVLAFLAYEAGDLAAMTAAAGRRAEDPRTEPVAAGLARLAGAAPLGGAVIEALARSPKPWGDIVAMDAALDAGDLARAQGIAAAWHGADKHPIRASRVARLLRYQGKNGAAVTAAASATPTLAARIEGALAAAEMASARTAAIAALAGGRTGEERWTAALLLARDGRVVQARAIVRDQAMPAADAPLLTRTVAALALVELKMKVPTHPMFLSLQEWTRNPDVARALGVQRPGPGSAAPAPDAPAPAPGAPPPASAPSMPRPFGKIPTKQGDDDPY